MDPSGLILGKSRKEKNLRRKDELGDLDIDGMMILKLI
jgi:hypothetical protein